MADSRRSVRRRLGSDGQDRLGLLRLRRAGIPLVGLPPHPGRASAPVGRCSCWWRSGSSSPTCCCRGCIGSSPNIYVPGYFIGRTRTGDGLLGDPVNLALLGHEASAARGPDRRRLDPGRRPDAMSRPRDDHGHRASGAAIRRRRSAPCCCSTGSRTSPTSRRSAAARPSDTTCASGAARRAGCCPAATRADWLVAGTYDRTVGLLPRHLPDHPQDRGRHRHRTGLRAVYGDPGDPDRRPFG